MTRLTNLQTKPLRCQLHQWKRTRLARFHLCSRKRIKHLDVLARRHAEEILPVLQRTVLHHLHFIVVFHTPSCFANGVPT